MSYYNICKIHVSPNIYDSKAKIQNSEYDNIRFFAEHIDDHFMFHLLQYFKSHHNKKCDVDEFDKITTDFLINYFDNLPNVFRYKFYEIYGSMTVYQAIHFMFVIDN